MATAAYRTWDARGRPFKVARPVVQMVAYADAHDIDLLGILGSDNTAHLQADFPEDHCPFSFTAEPLALPLKKAVDGEIYWVCACDLANAKGLGAAILRDARAGKLPWLKYMNFAGRNYHAADHFKQGAPNSDQHIHLSVWSDDLTTDIGGYDPLGDSDDMSAAESKTLKDVAWQVGHVPMPDGTRGLLTAAIAAWGRVVTDLAARGPVSPEQLAELKKVASAAARDEVAAALRAGADAVD